ncbi:MAG: hypothetical protein EA349_02110 [Halomonadaceae bacterium]|nr:MAG: hypothetical protein EA349_02110 [Halomonadaceae bacterium]
MKRLFYLVDSIDSVEAISKDLHEEGVKDWRFHVEGKNESGIYTRRLHTATFFEKKDFVRYVERGLMIGTLIGLVLVTFGLITGYPPLPLAAWVALFVFAVLAGGWIAGFGGVHAENYKIRPFHSAIENGEFLVMVDVPKEHLATMRRLMQKNHPEARLRAIDSNHTNPFSRRLRLISESGTPAD